MAKAKEPIVGTGDVLVDLAHWSDTVQTFRRSGDTDGACIHGFDLLSLVPELRPGHGIRLRVRVEVLDEGVPCPVRHYDDDYTKCTRKKAQRREARRKK